VHRWIVGASCLCKVGPRLKNRWGGWKRSLPLSKRTTMHLASRLHLAILGLLSFIPHSSTLSYLLQLHHLCTMSYMVSSAVLNMLLPLRLARIALAQCSSCTRSADLCDATLHRRSLNASRRCKRVLQGMQAQILDNRELLQCGSRDPRSSCKCTTARSSEGGQYTVQRLCAL
jgi:hypothetical protein